eukprot:4243604-Pyramimonas_sp.AAC.1
MTPLETISADLSGWRLGGSGGADKDPGIDSHQAWIIGIVLDKQLPWRAQRRRRARRGQQGLLNPAAPITEETIRCGGP